MVPNSDKQAVSLVLIDGHDATELTEIATAAQSLPSLLYAAMPLLLALLLLLLLFF